MSWENLVLNCALCLKYSTAKCKLEPSLALGQEISLYPWTKLATDIFSFWRGIIFTCCRLYKPLPSSVQAHIHDRSTYCKPVQTNLFWIWMAWHYSIRQWTMLYIRGLHQSHEWVQYHHITSSPHYPQSNGLAEKYVQIVKNLFYKAKEEGKDLYQSLMVYCNTPLSSSLQSPMQILASRSARSDLPMSNVARKQKGLDCEQLRIKHKNEQCHHMTSTWTSGHYQDPSDKRWYPATITRIVPRTKSYLITTKQRVQYRKTQAHLKPYHPQDEDELCKQEKHKWTIQSAQNHIIETNLAQSRTKRDIKPPNRLDL